MVLARFLKVMLLHHTQSLAKPLSVVFIKFFYLGCSV